jgi:hypothetical protein
LIRLILILLIFAVLLPPTAVAQASRDSLLGEEYAVYSAIILKHYVKDGVRLVVVTTPTCCVVSQAQKEQVMPRFQYSGRAEPFPSQETLDSYVERNRTSVDVHKLFRLNVAVQIVPYKRIESLFDMIELEEDWKTFYRMFPHSNGYIRFSRVGFNRAGNEAFVSTAWMSGSLSGEGRYVLLCKKDGRWNVENSVGTWVS